MKLARKHGVESLLPFTVKGTESKLRKRLEGGLRVKGTGVGERVKGKIEERTLKSRCVLTLYLLWRRIQWKSWSICQGYMWMVKEQGAS